jgi:glycosyltransferase involved in cell wall biosynthesis
MLSRNHILFISSWYPNRNNLTHGIFNKSFVQAAASFNQISVLHVCSDEHLSTPFEIVESNNENIITTYVYYKKVNSKIPVFSQLQKFYRFIKSYDLGYKRLTRKAGAPDLAQLNVVMPAGLGILFLFRKYKLPFIVNEGWTGYYPEDGNYKGFPLKYITKRVLSHAKLIMPVSERLKNAMLQHGLSGNYQIVPNIVDTTLFAPQNQYQQLGHNFIHVSTLDDRQKNVSGIIRAFSAATKKNPNLNLLIIGDGADRLQLEQLSEKLNLGKHIHFIGKLSSKELSRKINESDALVMFSNYETFCLTVAEALACGKPVITSRAGGLTDQISSSLGISLEVKDEVALCNAFTDFEKYQVKFNAVEMRALITTHFTPEIIGKQLTEIFNTVIEKEHA